MTFNIVDVKMLCLAYFILAAVKNLRINLCQLRIKTSYFIQNFATQSLELTFGPDPLDDFELMELRRFVYMYSCIQTSQRDQLHFASVYRGILIGIYSM